MRKSPQKHDFSTKDREFQQQEWGNNHQNVDVHLRENMEKLSFMGNVDGS